MIAILLVVALQASPAPLCNDKEGDTAAAECWTQVYKEADATLNAYWREVLTTARAADRSFSPTPRRDRASAVRDLIAAQRAWITYRDAECLAESNWAQGGSLQNVLIAQCLTAETKRRLAQLQAIESDFKEP